MVVYMDADWPGASAACDSEPMQECRQLQLHDSNLTTTALINSGQNYDSHRGHGRTNCARPGMCSPSLCPRTRANNPQNLPPELFDDIYQLVFTIGKVNKVEITEDYKPPAILQVDRFTREVLSPEYYRKALFTYDGTDASRSRFCRWLCSLSGDQLDMLHFVMRKNPGASRKPMATSSANISAATEMTWILF